MLLSTLPPRTAHSVTAQDTILLHRLTNGHVSKIDPNSIGGLLLVKRFYVDFAGPGAAVGGEFDHQCIAVYAIGTVRLQPLLTQLDREQAIQTRIAYANQLAAIVNVAHALHRARLIVSQLANWLPGNLSLIIPAELMAGLVGVLPKTIQQAWQPTKQISEDSPFLEGV